MSQRIRMPSLLTVIVVFSSSCSLSERPFTVAAICLHNNHEISQFVEDLHGIADTERLTIYDRSADTELESKRLDADAVVTRRGKAINLTFRGQSNEGFAVGNLGPDYQAVVGFSEGKNREAARSLSDRVLEKIGRRWNVKVAEKNRGASPIAECRPDGAVASSAGGHEARYPTQLMP